VIAKIKIYSLDCQSYDVHLLYDFESFNIYIRSKSHIITGDVAVIQIF